MSNKKELSNDQIEAAAAELSIKHKCEVKPLLFITDDDKHEQIVGYMRTPNRAAKMAASDKGMRSYMFAGADLLAACLIKDASDSRMYSDSQEHDSIYMGTCMAIMETIQISVEQLKKK